MEDPDPYDSRLDPCMTSIYHHTVVEQIYEKMWFFFLLQGIQMYI